MDKAVPPSAAILLDFIRKTEVGRVDRASCDVIDGNNQGKLASRGGCDDADRNPEGAGRLVEALPLLGDRGVSVHEGHARRADQGTVALHLAKELIKVGSSFTGIGAPIAAALNGILGNPRVATGYMRPVKDFVDDMPG